jgi:hypothetical protein
LRGRDIPVLETPLARFNSQGPQISIGEPAKSGLTGANHGYGSHTTSLLAFSTWSRKSAPFVFLASKRGRDTMIFGHKGFA